MQRGIYDSISDRGPDRVRCLLDALFDNLLDGSGAALTWKQLWERCWKEPLATLRGAGVQPAAKVRQAVYRAREILDRYFASEAGKRWAHRIVILPNEYRLQLRLNTEQFDLEDETPFLDEPFPGDDASEAGNE
jgi:hypothetical protein